MQPSMPNLHFLLLLLSTIILLTHAFSLEQGAQGRIPGSLSGPHKGDWLIDTRCDCTTPSNPRLGFVYQWEYYNYHSNATYLLSWLDYRGLLAQWNRGWVCREFDRPGKPAHRWSRKTDKFCFWPQEYQDQNYDWEDYVSWNEQQRGLGRFGKQGLRRTEKMKVDGVICPAMCLEWMRLEHNVGDATGKGEQKFWDHLDDMCDDCV